MKILSQSLLKEPVSHKLITNQTSKYGTDFSVKLQVNQLFDKDDWGSIVKE